MDPDHRMLPRVISPLLVLLLLTARASAQGGGVEFPSDLFGSGIDSSVVERGFTSGYLKASTVLMGHEPGADVKLWREASEVMEEDMFVPELLWQHFGVVTDLIDSDTLTVHRRAFYAGYNAAVERTLKRRYGAEVFEKIGQESSRRYRGEKDSASRVD